MYVAVEPRSWRSDGLAPPAALVNITLGMTDSHRVTGATKRHSADRCVVVMTPDIACLPVSSVVC